MKPFSKISVLVTLLIASSFNLQPTFAETTDPQLLKGWDLYHNGEFKEAFDYAGAKIAQKQHKSAWDELYGLASCEQPDTSRVPDTVDKLNADIRSEPKNDHLLATDAILLVWMTTYGKYSTRSATAFNRKALSYAMTAVGLAPNEGRNHAALGGCFAMENHTQEAIAEFDKAITLAPTDIDVNELASKFYANVLLDGKGSKQCFERLVKAHPNSLYLWKKLGNARETDGDPKGAIEAYSVALKKDPNYLPALRDRYGVYHHTFKWEPAIKDATTLIALKNNSYGDRAFCEEKLHQYDKALADTTKFIIACNKQKHELWKNVPLAKEDAYTLQFDGADRDYRKNFVTRATLYAKLGKYEKAIEELSPIMQADPHYAKGLECRQFWYRKVYRYKDALADLNKLLIIAPTSESYAARADVYAHLGERDKVAYDIRRAHELALPLP